ncbi:short-chain dehydrogenase [Cellulophaga omnivescoria]|uniref:short-chain dehydrogenase n=1 Tax=Cellulophaga omnivescoria TaxID=1888890 RepID=UPI003EBDDF6F
MKKILLLLIVILFNSCLGGDKTDEELLAIDKQTLVKSIDSDKVLTYKFAKILIRASAAESNISPEYSKFKSDLDRIFNKVSNYDAKDSESLSVLDYISIYRDYKKMEKFIMETDEDEFPTLLEVFSRANAAPETPKQNLLAGEQKNYVQNIEHSVLSAIVVLSRDIGKEVSLYECSKTNPELLPDSEIKALLQYYRGFLFFEKGLYYLSEDEISSNINWLNANKDVNLPLTRAMFQWGNLNNEQTHIGFHSLNHLFRGFDRLMMDRDIDEERALEDFEMFLNDSKKIGLDNEVIWSIESYLYLKKEKNDKAIAALKRLQASKLLSADEKERLAESIIYVQNREPGKVLNGFYDKYFLSKIATKYMLSILAKVDWQRLMEEQNVPHTKEIFETLEKFKSFTEEYNKYTSSENLEKTKDELLKQGESLWDQTKGLLD